MEQKNLDNRFFNFPLFVLPDRKKGAVIDKFRPILILVQEEDYQNDSKELLANILNAINISIDEQVYLLTIADDTRYNWLDYPTQLILSFGVPFKNIGIHYTVPPYRLLAYQDRQFLYVHDLTKIAAEKKWKAALWGEIKNFTVEYNS